MNKLADRRKEQGLSQRDLARLVGVSHSHIAMIETGRIRPSLPIALKLAKALGTTVEDLFDLTIEDRTPVPSK